MKTQKVLLLPALALMIITLSCRKPESNDPYPATPSSSKGVYDSLTKITDSFYVQDCVVYHKLKWAWWYIGAPAFISDTTVFISGTPCLPIVIPPEFFKIKDVTYEKYCLTYHEVTWHNQSTWPWGDRDTIYVSGLAPCYPAHQPPLAY